MKKVNLNGKLSLKKETIAKLNDEQMNVVKGGDTINCKQVSYIPYNTCPFSNCQYQTGGQVTVCVACPQ